MQPALSTDQCRFSLTSVDNARLRKFAPIFGFEFRQIDDKTYSLRSIDGGSACDVLLSTESAHVRLLNEIGSRAAKWVYFRVGTSCRDSLLGLSDARLTRVAELYVADREANSRRGT